MNWVELSVEADEEAVEGVAEQFRTHGAGVAIDIPFVQPNLEDEPTPDRSRKFVVKTYLADDSAFDPACRQIEQSLWHLSQIRRVGPLMVRRIAEEDWANSWKPFFPVLHVGARTVIVPAWRRYRKREEDVVVRLDPGLAFGTGTHPTTRLCLEIMEPRINAATRVLDVGTGSGILAIVAARLGAARVVGVDIDPMAVGAARANVKLNHLSGSISIEEGTPGVEGSHWTTEVFDLLLANLTAKTNARLAAPMSSLLSPGGILIASGILDEHADAVIEAFEQESLGLRERQGEGDWVALVFERVASCPS